MNESYNDVTVDISSNRICESECHTHVISSINIHSAIKLLKSGKNDSFDGLTSDYLFNASPLLYEYLSFLFTCMLHHSFHLPPSVFPQLFLSQKGLTEIYLSLKTIEGLL